MLPIPVMFAHRRRNRAIITYRSTGTTPADPPASSSFGLSVSQGNSPLLPSFPRTAPVAGQAVQTLGSEAPSASVATSIAESSQSSPTLESSASRTPPTLVGKTVVDSSTVHGSQKMSAKSETDIVVSCPICLENYSDVRYPVVSSNCGHSLCITCVSLQKNSVCMTCGKCNKSTNGNESKKNFALLDAISLIHQQNRKHQADLAEVISKQQENSRNDDDWMECVKCNTKEKKERMKICGTCAEKWNKEWKGMKEGEIRLFIICAFCSTESYHNGHAVMNYLPWKFNETLTTTVTNHQSTVSSMDELSHCEMERGKGCVELWKKEMDSCRAPGVMECETYRAGLLIVDVLNNECDLVTRASEDCLPPLRKYSKIVKDSTSRIQQLKKDVKEKKDLSGRNKEDSEESE